MPCPHSFRKMDDPIPPALVPPSATPSTIVLNSNPLLNRRQKMAEPLGEVTETSDSALASSAEASVTPIALKNKALLSQEEGIADDAVTPASPETNGAARSLQNSSLLSRRRTYAGGDQSTTGRAMETSESAPASSVEAGVNPIALKSNSLLSRRQKLAEANQSREEGIADDAVTPASPETNGAARSLQNSSLLSRRRTYAGGDQSTTGRAMETSESAPASSVEAGVNPIGLKSNSLLSRRQKLAEANQSREEGMADDTATEVVEAACLQLIFVMS